jgi:EmrB/QacA subfamily drug resistance transporter
VIEHRRTERTSAQDPPDLVPARLPVNPWIALLSLTLGYVIVLVYTGIVFTASAAIEHGLHASFAQLLWILNGFALVLALCLIPAGRIAQMVGPKRLFLIGLVWFTVITGAAGFARDANVLIALRLLQGVGAGLLTTQTLSYITILFPPQQRGAATGVWGGVTGTSGILGPIIGGFMVSAFDWQSIFYLAIPLGLIAFVATYLVVPEVARTTQHHLDAVGLVLLAGGLFSGLYALIEAQTYNWGPISPVGAFSLGSTKWSLWSIDSLLVYAVVLLALFVWRERRVEEPMLPLPLFRERNFVLGTTIGVIQTFTYFGLFTPIILFLETILGFSAVHAGLTLLPMGVCTALFAPLAGQLTQRINGKYVLVFGQVLIAAGCGLLIRAVALDNTSWSFVPALSLVGLGFAFSFVPATALTMRSASPRLASSGSGYLNASRQAAGSLGGAVMGTILANQVAVNLAGPITRAAMRFSPTFRASFAQVLSMTVGTAGQGSVAHLPANVPPTVLQHMLARAHQLGQVAFLNAMRPTLVVPLVATVGAVVAALFMRDDRTVSAVQEVDAGTSSAVVAD